LQAKKLDETWANLYKPKDKTVGEAVAWARAAQMFAEMLGMICHPEYYRSRTQKVIVQP